MPPPSGDGLHLRKGDRDADTHSTRGTGENRRAHGLVDEVVKARSVVAAQRHLPPRDSPIARAQLLAALEAYVASRTNLGRPIPYKLRDELRLRRLTRNA